MLCNKSSQDSLFVGAGVSLSCCVMSVVSAAPDTSRLEYQLGDLSVAFFFSKVPPKPHQELGPASIEDRQ